MRIADLPLSDRPINRLRTAGPETLSDVELYSIITGEPDLDQARAVLANGLRDLVKNVPPKQRPTRGARLAAAIELGRRLAMADALRETFDVEVVGRALITKCMTHTQEHLGALFLNSRLQVLADREIYIGTINHATVSTRDVIRVALEQNATAVVLYHNHPSGDPSPSAEDLMFTRKMIESLRLCDIELQDHIVVGAGRFYSMRQKGQI